MSDATTPPAAAPPAWVGWVRPAGGRWREVCRAATLDECERLLGEWRTPWQCTDRMVLPEGRKP